MDFLKKIKIPDFLLKQEPSIGLDIGSSSLKLIELEKKGKEKILKRFSYVELTPGADLGNSLSDFLKSQKLAGRQVNISVSGQSVVTRYLSWPRMTMNELKNAMQFEAKEYIPFPLEEVVLDCAIIKDNFENSKMLIVLAAIKKVILQERLGLLEKAGFVPKIIDVDCFCLANIFAKSYRVSDASVKEKTIALLNIGAQTTNMAIIDSGALRFSRDISFGVKGSALAGLSAEITTSIDYYENQNGRPVEKLLLSGGGSYSQDTLNFLSHQLNLPVDSFDILSGVAVDQNLNLEEFKPKKNIFTVALGLALR
ncbi:MAG: pilus assembly protein PilM [Candidatus Omnitrophota bacterium]|nr:pilus assembly protein PilM [Candidatus Omnitrophota bacterium]